MDEDIRWMQRFSNFRKALQNLDYALAIRNPDVAQRAGMVQFFEMCLELSWNMLKDYLESQGFSDLKSPRATLKKAFEIGLIEDGSSWLKGLEDRNLTSHLYNDEIASQVEQMIRDIYTPLFHSLDGRFAALRHEEE